jgi:hypothetical protein
MVNVNGAGTYTTSMGNKPGGYAPTQAGTYQWVVVYSGDLKNSPITSSFGSESEAVAKATPFMTTTPGGTVGAGTSQAMKDAATLLGGSTLGGSLTFKLYAPDGKTVVDSETVTVSGAGTYRTPNGYVPAMSAPTGTYQWVVSYSGDSNNTGITSPSGSEPECVVAPSCVQQGDFATIGFWHNCNGQALIQQVSGSLGTWLATNFPHLYGAAADPHNSLESNLAGKTNAQVGAFYQTLFNASGLNKTYAQIMAVALAVFVTDPVLAGGNYAQAYGFNMKTLGSGIDFLNVGSYGSALGFANNTNQTAYACLFAADLAAANNTLNGNLSAVNYIFNAFNQGGDMN